MYDETVSGRLFTYNLRFPGQYFDAETGVSNNVTRDYDPRVGRYLESDSIGLLGGLNTYSYVGGKPLSFIDPNGTAGQALAGAAGVGLLFCIGCYMTPGCKAAAENTFRTLFASSSSSSGSGSGSGSNSGSGSSGNVVPFPGKGKDKSCKDDDCGGDPCTELLAMLKLRMLQMLQLAGTGANMAFEIRQYEMARAEFCKVCPAMCSQAPQVPNVLKR